MLLGSMNVDVAGKLDGSRLLKAPVDRIHTLPVALVAGEGVVEELMCCAPARWWRSFLSSGRLTL